MYVLTMPLVAMVLLAFSSKEGHETISNLSTSIGVFTADHTHGLPAAFLYQDESLQPEILPLATNAPFKVSSTFGMRRDPYSKAKKMHLGIDFATPIGTEVLATADGDVAKVIKATTGYGNHIIIDHGTDYQTRYAQLSQMQVKVGDQVKQGQVIALSGNSGQSNGPHLHYEVYKNEVAVDPAGYINNYDLKKYVLLEKSKEADVEETVLEKQEFEQKAEQLIKDTLVSQKNVAALALIEAEISRKESEKAQIEMQTAALMAENRRLQAEAERLQAEHAKMQAEKAETQAKLAAELAKKEEEKARTVWKQDYGQPQPLFVLDGKEVSNISDVDPNTIKEVNVLKGDAARKLYGEKADNGVVIITTKKKQKGN